MAIYIESGGGSFERCPEGVHPAVCVGIWELGTQPSDLYEPSRQIMLSFEIVGEETSKGEPFFVSRTFTASLHEKSKLRPFIEAWRGAKLTEAELKAKYDIMERLGKSCQLAVTHATGGNGKTYANIASVMALPKGMQAPPPKTALSSYSIGDLENFPPEMPNFVKDKIRRSHQFRDVPKPSATDAATSHRAEVYAAFAGTSAAPPKIPPVSGGVPWEDGEIAY